MPGNLNKTVNEVIREDVIESFALVMKFSKPGSAVLSSFSTIWLTR